MVSSSPFYADPEPFIWIVRFLILFPVHFRRMPHPLGRIPGQGDGGFGAQYQNTTHAKVGDLGSALPHTPSGVTWTAGDTVEVAWTLQANHGAHPTRQKSEIGNRKSESGNRPGQRPAVFAFRRPR